MPGFVQCQQNWCRNSFKSKSNTILSPKRQPGKHFSLSSWGPWGITLIGKIQPLSTKTLLPSPAALTSLSYQFAALCTDTAESTGVSSSVYVFTRMRLLNRRDSRLYTIWSRGTGSIYGSLRTTPLAKQSHARTISNILYEQDHIQHFRAGH